MRAHNNRGANVIELLFEGCLPMAWCGHLRSGRLRYVALATHGLRERKPARRPVVEPAPYYPEAQAAFL